MFCFSDSVMVIEFSNSNSEDSEKIGIPGPPSFGGNDINFRSNSEHKTPLEIVGMNFVRIISSNTSNRQLIFGSYVDFRTRKYFFGFFVQFWFHY